MLAMLLLTVRVTVPVPESKSDRQPCTEAKACFEMVAEACQATEQEPPNRVVWDEGKRCTGWCGRFEDTRIKVGCDTLVSIDPRRFRRGSKERNRVEDYLSRLEAKDRKRQEHDVKAGTVKPNNAKIP
jgi:hypothetical protein